MQDRHASVQFSRLYAYRVRENLQPTELAGEGNGPPAPGANGAFLEAGIQSKNIVDVVVFTCMG